MSKDQEKTSIGLQQNVNGLLCYFGWFITGIIFLLIEKENKFVRFHAMQSIVTFGAFFAIQLVLALTIVLIVLVPIVNIVSLIVWVVLMVKSYQGEMFKLPIVGDVAEKWVSK